VHDYGLVQASLLNDPIVYVDFFFLLIFLVVTGVYGKKKGSNKPWM
jgi:hypothetical protein